MDESFVSEIIVGDRRDSVDRRGARERRATTVCCKSAYGHFASEPSRLAVKPFCDAKVVGTRAYCRSVIFPPPRSAISFFFFTHVSIGQRIRRFCVFRAGTTILFIFIVTKESEDSPTADTISTHHGPCTTNSSATLLRTD